jgi:formamidopyrimidine-DNA glycosylase
MPELPEVETIKTDLHKLIIGKKIMRVNIYNPKVIRQPSPAVFKKSLEGQTIKQLLRRGKLLILELSNGKFLTVHLKMTGQLVIPGGAKSSRVSFNLSGGMILDFNDQRLFGELRLVDDWKKLPFIQRLGPEPFDLTYPDFKQMILKKKTTIKPLLLDQSFISGIGNIYAAEILFHAKINPQRSAQSLTEKEKQALYRQMQRVLKSAIKHGGSSVDDYVRVSGRNGQYGRLHKVYNRQGKPCLVCAKPVERISQGGRGTYFCSHCQPSQGCVSLKKGGTR